MKEMEPTRIPPSSGATVHGAQSAGPIDPQQQIKQVQQEDRVQLSAEAAQIAQLKSDMDVAADQRRSQHTNLQKPTTEKKSGGVPSSPPKRHSSQPGNRLDVQG